MQNTKNRLASAFLSSFDRFPGRNALQINEAVFSYADLMRMSAGIAQQLEVKSRGPRVAIYCTHSPWTYASVLAVTMLGGSYVPLNPKFPRERLQEIIELSKVSVLLSEKKLDLKVEELLVETKPGSISDIKPVYENDEAYLLFTSGTTGIPKGVPVSFSNLDGFFDHFSTFDFNEEDRFIQSFELSFDVSVMMMFLCWGAGACLYPVSPEGHKPFNVLSCIREHEITVCAMVPSLLSYVGKYLPGMQLPHVRHTFFAGERLSVHFAELWQKACPAARIFNAYGPSECTIVCMAHEFDPAAAYGADVPIGKTFRGTSALLFDEHLEEVKRGQGEICIGGKQVISHYLDFREEERFFARAGERFYRTGDLGHRDKNGDLVFSGRVDEQMKINGYRIEPAEITLALKKACGRHSEIILVKNSGQYELVAFIEGADVPPRLGERLLELLPVYMVPREFIPVEKFPIGTHDKVDKKRLVQLYYERNHT